jgi:hypothetical protein
MPTGLPRLTRLKTLCCCSAVILHDPPATFQESHSSRYSGEGQRQPGRQPPVTTFHVSTTLPLAPSASQPYVWRLLASPPAVQTSLACGGPAWATWD